MTNKTIKETITRLQKLTSEKKAAQSRESAKVIQLPLWSEPKRGVPNDILRSALFAAIQGKGRKHVKQHLVAAYDGLQVKYTGEELEQSDLDVWEQVLHLVRQSPLGSVCYFSGHEILKALGRRAGKSDYQWLHSVLLRLASNTVEFYKDRQIYGRGMVEHFAIDEATRRYKVSVDPETMELYLAGWTAIDWGQRQRLRGKPLALWLHGYYASHAQPAPVKVETLRRMCGSKTASLRHFREKLRKALDDLKAIDAIQNWRIDDSDLVYVNRGAAITPSQRRHLTHKQPRGKRKD
jgi:hypothetical protein